MFDWKISRPKKKNKKARLSKRLQLLLCHFLTENRQRRRQSSTAELYYSSKKPQLIPLYNLAVTSFSLVYYLLSTGEVVIDFFKQSTTPSQCWGVTQPASSLSSKDEWGDRRFPGVWQALIVLQCSASSSLMFRNTSYKFSAAIGNN